MINSTIQIHVSIKRIEICSCAYLFVHKMARVVLLDVTLWISVILSYMQVAYENASCAEVESKKLTL